MSVDTEMLGRDITKLENEIAELKADIKFLEKERYEQIERIKNLEALTLIYLYSSMHSGSERGEYLKAVKNHLSEHRVLVKSVPEPPFYKLHLEWKP